MRRAFFVVPGAVNTWSLADIRRLRELAAAGVHVKQISLALNRTESAVRNKAAMHYISLATAAPRKDPQVHQDAQASLASAGSSEVDL